MQLREGQESVAAVLKRGVLEVHDHERQAMRRPSAVNVGQEKRLQEPLQEYGSKTEKDV